MKGGKTFRRWFRPLLLVLAIGFFVSLYQSWIRIPANVAPWGQVEPEQPPGWLARMQINSLAADPPACIAALDRSALAYRRTPARPIVDGCGLEAVVRPLQSHIAYNRAFDVTCGMMAALYRYEAELQRLAQQHLGSRVTRIDQLGTYACRNVNSAASGRRSQHATANAIDLAGFRLADGRSISILDDWSKDTPKPASSPPRATRPAASSTSCSARTTTGCTQTTSTSTSAASGCAGDEEARFGRITLLRHGRAWHDHPRVCWPMPSIAHGNSWMVGPSPTMTWRCRVRSFTRQQRRDRPAR